MPVNDRICSTGSPSEALTVCVAPNCSASASLESSRSTPITSSAPESAAACTALRPTPPQPKTATRSPGETFASLKTAATPVVTPQPTSAIVSSGASLRTGIAPVAGTTLYSANEETKDWLLIRSPPLLSRLVPSKSAPSGRIAAIFGQSLKRPAPQARHSPQ